jgi:CHRD domain
MKNILSFFPKCFCGRNGYLFLFAFAGAVACGKSSSSARAGGSISGSGSNINYTGTFMKSDLVDSTMGNGSVMGVFNPATLTFNYTITWHSLSSEPIAMHFHDNGPVIITITGFPVSTDQTFSGTANFSTQQASDLALGYIFVMIHTQTYVGGEIMAPLKKE